MTEQEAYDEVRYKYIQELTRIHNQTVLGSAVFYFDVATKLLQLVEVKHPDQSVPEIDPHNRNCEEGCMDPGIAQQDMLSQGWKRCINKEALK